MNEPAAPPARLHLPCLLLALLLMLALTAYPLLAARHGAQADHGLATLLLWAMSAGFVRGVGFVPRWRLPRLLLGAPACLLALTAALLLKML
jgi:predicted membrane protein